jgi:diamine N-acetyltransferase
VRPPAVTFRVARPSDAATMARTAHLGLDTYRAFAPAGWEPVPPPFLVERMTETLGKRTSWALLAEVAGEPAAHVAMMRDWTSERTAYLWQLFVRPPWWGSGLADELHDAFIAEARERGFPEARLHTPARHARALRFYERRGWRPVGPPGTWIAGLPVLEHRRPLRD